MAHGAHKLQFEVVAVLCLIALFTHIHAFWVAALLLALIDIPDFGGWLGRIAGAVERIAGPKPGDGATQAGSREATGYAKPVEASQETKGRSVKQKEPTHA
jgi:hypothetical protein